MKSIQRRTLLTAMGAAAAVHALPVRAQDSGKIVFGYTAVTDFASVFVAAEEGYFKKRHLDVECKFIPLNSTIPAALQSDSLQIGGPTPSVFLQAVDGGLDLQAVAGGGLTSKTITGFGLVAREIGQQFRHFDLGEQLPRHHLVALVHRDRHPGLTRDATRGSGRAVRSQPRFPA